MPIDDITLQDEGEKPSRVDGYAEKLIMAEYEKEAHEKRISNEIERANRMLLYKEIVISIFSVAVTWYAIRTWLFQDWARDVEQVILNLF